MVDRPHIVLITADELHAGALSCYGQTALETPNIDRLADRGVQFDSTYTVSPWCLPARCSLATGQLPHNHGSFANYEDWSGRLDPSIPNLYSVLGDRGYATAHVGKCHYSPVPRPEQVDGETIHLPQMREHYLELGMDTLVLQDGNHRSTMFYDDWSEDLEAAGYLEAYRDAAVTKAQENQKVFTFPGPAELYKDVWIGEQSVDVLEDQDPNEPSFTWVSFSGPHYPFDPPEEYLEAVDESALSPRITDETEWDDEDRIHYKSFHGSDDVRRIDANGVTDATWTFSESYWQRLRRHYLGNVAAIDEQVGRVLDTVEERFGDDALVVFASDHGEMLGNHGLWGKHNCFYEDVWNIPLLVDFPESQDIERSSAMTSLTDITATCFDMAGAEIPERDIDGTDLRRQIETGGYDYVLAEGQGFVAIRDERYKYAHLRGQQQVDGALTDEWYREFIDMESDPNEFENRAKDPAAASAMSTLQTELVNRFMEHVLPYFPRASYGERPYEMYGTPEE
jgi:arylsulfatase A-like enzyme